MKMFVTEDDLEIINAQLNAGNDVSIKRVKDGYKITSEIVRTIKKSTSQKTSDTRISGSALKIK